MLVEVEECPDCGGKVRITHKDMFCRDCGLVFELIEMGPDGEIRVEDGDWVKVRTGKPHSYLDGTRISFIMPTQIGPMRRANERR